MAEQTALEQWIDKYGHRDDRPRISVWYPRQAPFARLETVTRGAGDAMEEYLRDPQRIHAHLTLAGIDIGGLLEDLELMVSAAQEALAAVRKYADNLVARDTAS